MKAILKTSGMAFLFIKGKRYEQRITEMQRAASIRGRSISRQKQTMRGTSALRNKKFQRAMVSALLSPRQPSRSKPEKKK